jgi:FkbM family methyltransferase
MESSGIESAFSGGDFDMRGARVIDRLLLKYARMPDHPAKQRLLTTMASVFNPRPIIRLPSGGLLRFPYDDFLGWNMLQRGQYEPQSLELVINLLSETPGLFVDVGANVGYFTVAAAALLDVRVVALEADCSNCDRLRANVRLNDLSNVNVFNGGASNRVAVAAISRRHTENSGSAFTAARGEALGAADWVPLMTLEEVLDSIVLEKERPVLIKIDVEGTERDVLLGLDWSGGWRPKNILMEYNSLSEPAWGSLAEIATFFDERGYQISDVTGRSISLGGSITEDNLWIRDVTGIDHRG